MPDQSRPVDFGLPGTLSVTAQWALRTIATHLAGKFTGKIEVICCDGGVTAVVRTETERPPKKK